MLYMLYMLYKYRCIYTYIRIRTSVLSWSQFSEVKQSEEMRMLKKC